MQVHGDTKHKAAMRSDNVQNRWFGQLQLLPAHEVLCSPCFFTVYENFRRDCELLAKTDKEIKANFEPYGSGKASAKSLVERPDHYAFTKTFNEGPQCQNDQK